MAQNLVLDGTIFNGVDSIAMTNENGEKVTYVEKVNTGTGDPVAKIGDVEYASVQDALKAAVSGDVVTMIADSDESNAYLSVEAGITLDLDGHTLAAKSLTAFENNQVVDTSVSGTNVGSGTIIVPKNRLNLQSDNQMLSVWNGENGYNFVSPSLPSNNIRYDTTSLDGGFKLTFRPSCGTDLRTKFRNNGGELYGMTMKFRITWKIENGMIVEQYFTYTDDLFKGGFNASFTMTVTGIGNLGEVTGNVIMVSGTGAEYVSQDFMYGLNE